MLQKLPDSLTSRWNRHVTKQLRQTEEFPDFKEFAEFVVEEAYIACNPITSFQALRSSEETPSRDANYPKADAFSTNLKADNYDKSVTGMKTYYPVESSSNQVNTLGKSEHASISFKCSNLSVL